MAAGTVASKATIVESERMTVEAAPAAAAVPSTMAGVANEAPEPAPAWKPYQTVPPSRVKNVRTSTDPAAVARVGAVPPCHTTEPGQVTNLEPRAWLGAVIFIPAATSPSATSLQSPGRWSRWP